KQLSNDWNYPEAVKEWEKVFAWSRKLNGDQAIETLIDADYLVTAHLHAGQLDKVEALCLFLLKGLSATRGQNSLMVAEAYNRLAEYYSMVGQMGKALDSITKAEAIFQAKSRQRDVSQIQSNMATIYEQIGLCHRADDDEAKARAAFEKARTLLEANLEY